MAIASVQRRLNQIGVIRLGEQRIAKSGKPYPAKLETFRLTSPSRHFLEVAAQKYGGEVKPWPESPNGVEYQVTTASTALEIYVLPQVIDPNMELWGNRHRQRICDTITERIRNVPCMCEATARLRYQKAGIEFPEDGRFARDPRYDCKPTTRISVVLRDIGDGQWKIESHGWNAAAELPTKATIYLRLARREVPAILRLEQRDQPKLVIENGEEKVDARKFAVPVLDFGDLFTMSEALTAGGVDAAVERALAGQQRLAIGSAAAARNWLDEIEAADAQSRLDALKGEMRAAGVRDQSIVDAWIARSAELREPVKPKPDTAKREPVKPAEPQSATSAVLAVQVTEGEPAPDRDTVWMGMMQAAKTAGWKLPDLKAKYEQVMGHAADAKEADGWAYQTFLDALKSGRVPA